MTKARQNQGWKKFLLGMTIGGILSASVGLGKIYPQEIPQDNQTIRSTESVESSEALTGQQAMEASKSLDEVLTPSIPQKKTKVELDIGYASCRNVGEYDQFSVSGLKLENEVSNVLKIHGKTNGYLNLDSMLLKAGGSYSNNYQTISNNDILQLKADLVAGIKRDVKPWLNLGLGAGYGIEYTNTASDLVGVANMDVNNTNEESLSGPVANLIVTAFGIELDGKYKMKNGQSKNTTSVSSSLYNINQNLVERANLSGNEYSIDVKANIKSDDNKIVEIKGNVFEQTYTQKDKINNLTMYDSKTDGYSLRVKKDITTNFSGYVEYGETSTTERLNDLKTKQTSSNFGVEVKF